MDPNKSLILARELLRDAYPGRDLAGIESWRIALEGIDPHEILAAARAWVQSDSPFPPAPGQLRRRALQLGRLEVLNRSPHEILDAAKIKDGLERQIALAAGALQGDQGVFWTAHPSNDPGRYNDAIWRVKDFLEHAKRDPESTLARLSSPTRPLREIEGPLAGAVRSLVSKLDGN